MDVIHILQVLTAIDTNKYKILIYNTKLYSKIVEV